MRVCAEGFMGLGWGFWVGGIFRVLCGNLEVRFGLGRESVARGEF